MPMASPAGPVSPPLAGRRRLSTLSTPARAVPFKASLYNPERLPRSSSAWPFAGSGTKTLAATSPVGSPAMRKSKSVPALPPIQSSYNRCCPIIFGGVEYRRSRPSNITSKFMDFLPKEGDEAAERNRLRRAEAVRKMMKESARIFKRADGNGDGQLDFDEYWYERSLALTTYGSPL
jgi:hypothetical protein